MIFEGWVGVAILHVSQNHSQGHEDTHCHGTQSDSGAFGPSAVPSPVQGTKVPGRPRGAHGVTGSDTFRPDDCVTVSQPSGEGMERGSGSEGRGEAEEETPET